MTFFTKTRSRKLSLLLIAIFSLYLFSNHPAQTYAAVVLDQNFAQAIDSTSPFTVSSSNAGASITANVADAAASDGKVARFTLPAGSAASPDNGPNLQTKSRYQYGTYEARLKTAPCTSTEGMVTGLFTYYNDGSDTNGNGLPDNSEIDIEVLCAEPQTIWLTMWTDYDGATNANRRVSRAVDLSTGTIKYTHYAENFDTFTDISGSPTENQPTSIAAIPGFNSSTAYYEYGWTWTSTGVTWYIKHPTTGAKIILWDYHGPAARITTIPAYYMVNVWHTNDWTPDCCSAAIGAPKVNTNIYLDWLRYSTIDTTVPTNTPAPTTSPNGTPYSGTPAAVPGRIEAENYNLGGQGVAYSDNEAANQGGAYRTTEGVDVEPSTDTGAGYNIGYTITGEYTKYTVNVTAAGTYTANFRVASAQAGGAIHLEVDGVNVTGSLVVPNTGGWQTWTTVTKTGISLTAGQHVLKLVTDATGGNYNWFEFVGSVSPTATKTNTPVPPTATKTNTPTSGTNIALNKSATALNTCAATEGANLAFDGSVTNNSKWCGVISGSSTWLRVDLGAVYSLTSFTVKHAGAGGESTSWNTKDFQIQTSTDDVNWSTAVTVTGNTASTTTHPIAARNARYARLWITIAGSDTAARIYEFEVYGTATTVPTNTNTSVAPTATKTNTSVAPTATKTNTPVPPTSTPSSTDGSPYSGTPAPIPGRIEAENYNTGGQGIAYSDNEAANQGNAYRTTDGVDIEACTDTGCGYNIGWTVNAEYTKYTVNVSTAGAYTANFRVASAQAGGAIHLEVDNVNVTGSLTVPNTGGWQTWTTVTKTGLNLTAGQHVLKLVTDVTGGNYNWFELISGTVSPTATPTTPPTVAPTKTNTPVPASGKFLMAYYPSWGSLPVLSIPANKLTHVLYAFSDLNSSGQCAVAAGDDAATHMSQFKTLKQQYPHLKVIVSVGGWSLSDYFSANVATAAKRQALVSSCINLWIKGTGLAGAGAVDGIDIDWEFPGAPGETNNYSTADKANYVALMQEFRSQLNTQGAADGKTYTISAALNTTAGNISAGYDLAGLAPVLDFFMLMTYDFHGSWEPNGPTNFHSNLYPVTGDPAGNTLNVQAAVGRFTSAGVPASKIIVGVPFYGAGWTGVGSGNNGLFQPASGTITVTYKDIKANYESNVSYTKFRHAEARTVWVYSAATGTFIGYDDPQTMQDKAQYVVNSGLKGAMFWEQSQDDSTFSLTQSLCTNLGLAASGRC